MSQFYTMHLINFLSSLGTYNVIILRSALLSMSRAHDMLFLFRISQVVGTRLGVKKNVTVALNCPLQLWIYNQNRTTPLAPQ